MFDLCIGIVYHDRTAPYILNLLKSIPASVNINGTYQILIFDNCEHYKEIESLRKSIESVGDNIKVIFETLDGNPHNWYQFEARKQIIKNANSKYIWFVDSDDSIIPFTYDFSQEDTDIVTFKFKATAGFRHCWWTKPDVPIYWETIDYNQVYSTLNVMLWNKWIKTSLLKEHLDCLTEDKLEIVGGEDSLFNFISWKYGKNIKFLNMNLYYYNTLDSLSAKETYKDLKVLQHLLKGQQDFIRLTKNIFTEDELNKINFHPIEESFSYYMSRANRYCLAKRRGAYKIIRDTFGKKTSEKLLATPFVIFKLGELRGLSRIILKSVFNEYIDKNQLEKFMDNHLEDLLKCGSLSECWDKYHG